MDSQGQANLVSLSPWSCAWFRAVPKVRSTDSNQGLVESAGKVPLSLPLELLADMSCEGGFPGGTSGKEPACQCRRRKRFRFDPCVGMIPWRRAWQPTPVFLPGESHGQRSLAGYSPWGREETRLKRLSTHARTCTLYSDAFLWTFLKPDQMARYSTLCILVGLTVTDYTH